ncbi:MAG: hypothetical protein WC371_01925 [Parachlamydiales bacterium]|jgi:hypothetical protein
MSLSCAYPVAQLKYRPFTLTSPEKTREETAFSAFLTSVYKIIDLIKILLIEMPRKSGKRIFKAARGFLQKNFPKFFTLKRSLAGAEKGFSNENDRSEKTRRHEKQLKELALNLEELLAEDQKLLEQGLITEETHLMRYLQLLSRFPYSLDAAPLKYRLPPPLNFQLLSPEKSFQYLLGKPFQKSGCTIYPFLAPANCPAPALLIAKGTSTTKFAELLADLDPQIGSKAFEAVKDRLKDWLDNLRANDLQNRRIIVTGHSLGGAIAQRIACDFFFQTEQLVTFNAPSPGKKTIARFKAKMAKAGKEQKETPAVAHFVNKRDLIPLAGGTAPVPGHIYELPTPQNLNRKECHSYLADITNATFCLEQKTGKHRFLRIVLEICRLIFSFFFSWAVYFLAKKQEKTQLESQELKTILTNRPSEAIPTDPKAEPQALIETSLFDTERAGSTIEEIQLPDPV